MISYLGSLVQFSPAMGRAGRCRQISLCVDSTRRVPATLGLPRAGVSLLSPSTLLRLPAALYGAGPVLSAPTNRRRVLGPQREKGRRTQGKWAQAPGFLSCSGRGRHKTQAQHMPPVGCLRWLAFVQRSWPPAATLPAADVDHPESQEVFR